MADEWAKIPLPAYNRIADATRRVEAQSAGDPDWNSRHGHNQSQMAVLKVTGCTKATGYATAQFCTGDPSAPVADTSTSVKVFLSKDGPYQKDDFIIAAPVAMPNIHWVAVCPLTSFFKLYAAPTAGELATTQDNPSASAHCTESVSIP